MAKFVTFFSYTPTALQAMLDSPADRAEPVRRLVESVGGTLEVFYWMFGEYDGFAVSDMPDSTSAGGVGAAVASSGAIARIATYEVLDADARSAMLEHARTAVGAYQPPA